MALTAAFDQSAIDQLLLLADATVSRTLILSGDGVTRFASLIAAGYATYRMKANNNNMIVTYEIGLTDRGDALVGAWRSGRRADVEAALAAR